ncbi:MAG TPA: helix-turn-helix domain-containing protein [Alphaproteobacteria bacterium]|nr:helix-turn-helix domain-containing protein [Alphaproteobacteria bacterium]
MLLVTQTHEGAGDPFGPDEVQCPIRELLARVGGRWSLDVIVALGREPRHFGDLARTIPGVSRRMLSLTLRGMERDGLVARTPQIRAGERVFYELSALGDGLASHVRALGAWSQHNREAIYAARERYDATQERYGT